MEGRWRIVDEKKKGGKGRRRTSAEGLGASPPDCFVGWKDTPYFLPTWVLRAPVCAPARFPRLQGWYLGLSLHTFPLFLAMGGLEAGDYSDHWLFQLKSLSHPLYCWGSLCSKVSGKNAD